MPVAVAVTATAIATTTPVTATATAGVTATAATATTTRATATVVTATATATATTTAMTTTSLRHQQFDASARLHKVFRSQQKYHRLRQQQCKPTATTTSMQQQCKPTATTMACLQSQQQQQCKPTATTNQLDISLLTQSATTMVIVRYRTTTASFSTAKITSTTVTTSNYYKFNDCYAY